MSELPPDPTRPAEPAEGAEDEPAGPDDGGPGMRHPLGPSVAPTGPSDAPTGWDDGGRRNGSPAGPIRPPGRARRIAGAWFHAGAAGAWGLLALGLVLYLLAWPPGPLPWLVLAADAPFLWLLYRDADRWKRWVFLYSLLHYCAGFWWLAQITWIQVFIAALFMTPIYLAAGAMIRWLVRRRVPWLLVVPTVLVFEEMTRTVYMGGMPLPMRSLALSTSEAFTASTAYLGAYGLSFLSAMGGAAIARLPFHHSRPAPEPREVDGATSGGVQAAGAPSGPTTFRLRRPTWRRALVDGAVVALVGAVLYAVGTVRIADRTLRLESSAPRVLAAVQAAIPQSTKHNPDPDAANRMFQRHLDLSTKAIEDTLAAGEEVVAVLWPETMVPWELVDPDLAARLPEAWENEVRILQNVQGCVPPMSRPPRFLLGAIYQFRRGDERHLDLRAYGTHDSLFLVDPDAVPSPDGPYPPPPPLGERPSWEIARHDKHVLVPGGEYTPLGEWIPPLRWVRNIVSVIPELDPGPEDQEPLTLIDGPPSADPAQTEPAQTVPGGADPAEAGAGGTHSARTRRPGSVRAGTIICFEMLSPGPCRARRAAGADVLLNPSNYGWFGRTTFRAQIRAVARLRAAETATTVVVAGNTGPTLFYDPLGRPYGRFRPTEGGPAEALESDANTYRRGYAVAPLLVDPEPTPYVWWGDLPWLGLGLSLLGFGMFTPRPRDAPVTERGYPNTC